MFRLRKQMFLLEAAEPFCGSVWIWGTLTLVPATDGGSERKLTGSSWCREIPPESHEIQHITDNQTMTGLLLEMKIRHRSESRFKRSSNVWTDSAAFQSQTSTKWSQTPAFSLNISGILNKFSDASMFISVHYVDDTVLEEQPRWRWLQTEDLDCSVWWV